jgi:uncharacterized repeat protein (TIGR01451 family)/fimbrial isopeptide formation D2 family protein
VKTVFLSRKFSPANNLFLLCPARDKCADENCSMLLNENTNSFCEKSVMKNRNRKNMIRSNALLALLAVAMLATAVTKTATAKSLYVIADIKGASEDRTQPVQAYDIGVDGTLLFQAQHDIPHSMLGAVGMAIDSDYGYVFITYEASGDIQLIEATTMTDAGNVTAPDATDLAGIVYDHDKSLLYCVDRRKDKLYVYNWWPETATLTHVSGSPFILRNASAYGIALDEIDDLLFVANASNSITVYSTSTWELVNTITVSRIAISIAVDVTNGLLYTGGGFAGNPYLTQYHLATGIEAEVQVEPNTDEMPNAGVMGLGVDTDTGLVYLTTGSNNAPGGDNLLVYDSALNQIDIITAIGNPTGLAIPGRDIGYNPLNLSKQVLRGATASADSDEIKIVSPGDNITYGIYFDNTNNSKVADVSIVDILPNDVTFVTASDDGVNGQYDYNEKTKIQTYTWTYKDLPPGTSTLLEITVKVNNDVEIGKTITNSVTINTNETPPTTTSVDVITGSNALNLKKGILGSLEGQITQVDSNDIITYTIDFDNKDNEIPVTDITVVDTLPKNVTFINPDDGKDTGKYNSKAHTYTWSFNSLEPGAEMHLELAVSVNPGVPMGTIITNTVTVDCNEAPQSTASVDAIITDEPIDITALNITKKVVDESGAEIQSAMPGERFIYQICFDSGENDFEISDVSIVDVLPESLSFVNDEVNNTKFIGNYDSKAHTYTGTIKSLEPGSTICLELLVEINSDTPLGTTINNSVTINSTETPPATTDADVYIGEILLEVANLDISPSQLRRNGTSPNIMAVVRFPQGILKSDIDENDQPELYYQDRDSNEENFILIGEGRQTISGTESSPGIRILFDRAELMDALYGYGQFTLRVEGTLKSGRIYFGEATILVTRFAGD